MLNVPVKSSAYADHLYNKIDDWFRQQGRGFTVQEIAAFAGMKVTHNLRTRLNHSVATKRLGAVYCLCEDGRQRLVYVGYDQIMGDADLCSQIR